MPRRRLVPCLAAFGLVCTLATLPSHATPQFHPPVGMPASGTEPGIDIAPDGTVFVNATTGLGVHSVLNRSTDGGATWTQVPFPPPWGRLPGGGDTEAAVAPGGRVYFLDLWVGSNSLTFSPDNGATWTRGTPLSTLPLTDRQWLAVGPRDPATGNDTLYVAYQKIEPNSAVWIARSSDGGMLWEHHLPVSTVDAFPGAVVADGDFVAVQWYDQAGDDLYVSRSTNRGASFTAHLVAENVDGSIWSQAGLALDGDHLYSVSLDDDTLDVELHRSTDRGLTWELPVVLSDPTHGRQFPWVAARGGKVAVAWYGSDDYVGHSNGAPTTATWVIKYAESPDGGLTWTPEVTATPPGDIVKRGPICTSGLGCNGNRELGDFLQVAIDGGGNALISYVDISRTKVLRQA